MKDTKFMKAYCRKTGQYFGLEVKRFGPTWKVVNMIRLSDAEARVISSEVEQSGIETNDNLIACPRCGVRLRHPGAAPYRGRTTSIRTVSDYRPAPCAIGILPRTTLDRNAGERCRMLLDT